MTRTALIASIDRDEPLELLAADRRWAGDETATCSALAPLLAVEPQALAADDRAALVTHLTGCARCRAVGVDLWLDGVVAPPEAMAIAPLPRVRQLARRSRRRTHALVGAALAACLGGGVLVATQSERTAATSRPVAAPGTGSHTPAPGGAAALAPRPWAHGVTKDEQAAAVALFSAGNTLLRDDHRADAAVRYREALTHWDHPAIWFNLALTMVDDDQPVELRRALIKATRYGAAPMDDEKYRRAQDLLAQVDRVLTRVEFATQIAGAVLVIDDRAVFTGPGHFQDFVRAGRHTWTVRVDARSLPARPIVLAGGTTETLPDVDGELTR